jgi:hypothetical protein
MAKLFDSTPPPDEEWMPTSRVGLALKRLSLRLKGVHPFYAEMKRTQIALYQHYFNRMIAVADVKNLTDRSHGRPYSQESYDKDYKVLDAILREAETNGLMPHYLQVLFEQYIWADVLGREWRKDDWVETARHCKMYDFIHDPGHISRDFFVDAGK